MRVLVCGGRHYKDRERLYRELDSFRKRKGIRVIISGTARGADSLAIQWADSRNIPVESFPAKWNEHGRAAGPIRNQQMLDEGKPDWVIVFPGGRGTANMYRRALDADISTLAISE